MTVFRSSLGKEDVANERPSRRDDTVKLETKRASIAARVSSDLTNVLRLFVHSYDLFRTAVALPFSMHIWGVGTARTCFFLVAPVAVC